MAAAKGTVLIVDDKQELATTLGDVLEEIGFTVMTALDGYQALERCKTPGTQVDVALIDIVMPGMNGVETYKAIKRLSPATAVIMITGFAVENLVREALQEGAHAVIYKPFDLPKILKAIDECLGSVLVLIVDDDAAIRGTLEEILVEKGYKITSASSGFEAIKRVKEGRYDIIFLDIVMPGISGDATFLEIHRIDPRACVIMMTGHAVEEVVKNCLEGGAYACLYKPYNPEQVINLIKEIIEQKKRETPS